MTNTNDPKEDAVLYCDVMNRIKYYIICIEELLKNEDYKNNDRNDLLTLHFRRILELIGFSSLIFHRKDYALSFSNFKEHWNARKILIQIENKINKEFYPQPCYRDESRSAARQHHFEIRKVEYLTWELWKQNIDQLSDMIHESNPFREERFAVENDKYFRYLKTLIINLLDSHFIVNRGKYAWICNMQEKDGQVHCYQAEVKAQP